MLCTRQCASTTLCQLVYTELVMVYWSTCLYGTGYGLVVIQCGFPWTCSNVCFCELWLLHALLTV